MADRCSLPAVPDLVEPLARRQRLKHRPLNLYYHAMLLPGVVLLLIFSYVPMAGLVIAFQKYSPVSGILGSPFVGLGNFRTVLMFPDAGQVIYNTVFISVTKILLSLAVPVVFALALNECRSRWLKRGVQTIVYMPNFLSWVIVAAMFSNIFSLNGIVNMALKAFGLKEPILFMASNAWFRPIVIFTDAWKSFGFTAVVYIAAISGIDPNLYEAAEVDGAGRGQKIAYITLPCILPTIVLMATLSLRYIFEAGFEQVFNMYNPLVYQTGDILDTYVYRLGLVRLQYSLGTALGLFKSVTSLLMIYAAYRLADRYAGYSIF